MTPKRTSTLWRTTVPPINLATFLFSILDSKRRLGTFKVSFGLILLMLFFFLMALFFDWKVYRVLMVVGLSSPLSKSYSTTNLVLFSGRKWRKSKKSRIPPPSIGVDPGGTWGARRVVWSTRLSCWEPGSGREVAMHVIFHKKSKIFQDFLKLDLFDHGADGAGRFSTRGVENRSFP